MTPRVEEFYNHVHDKNGRFANRRGGPASGREGFREGSHGGARNEANGFDPTRVPRKGKGGERTGQTGHGVATPENWTMYDGRKGPSASRTVLKKQGKALMIKQAAHRKEAARQIDLRNERLKAARQATNHKTTTVPSREATRHPEYGETRAKAAGKFAYRPNVRQKAQDERRRAAHLKGETDNTPSSGHSKVSVSRGTIHTSLKGSHTIRKTKSGQFVLHTKSAPPAKITKSAADHIKKLDQHKPSAADEIRARIQRWHAKD